MKWFPWLTRVFLAAALALGWVGCKPAATATATGASSAEETPREYSVRGVVRRVEPERRSVVVKHEEIPGFMPAMTMPFDVKEPKELNGLKPGDQIAFRMLVTTNDGWIDRIQVVGSDTNAVATPPPVRITSSVPLLEAGSMLPDYTLTNELGHVIRLSDFRGKVLAFTFIFTRCPYPDFCPRMTDLFARAQKICPPKPMPRRTCDSSPSHSTRNTTPRNSCAPTPKGNIMIRRIGPWPPVPGINSNRSPAILA